MGLLNNNAHLDGSAHIHLHSTVVSVSDTRIRAFASLHLWTKHAYILAAQS